MADKPTVVPSLWTLTDITGRNRNEGRTAFIATIEVKREFGMRLLKGLVPGAAGALIGLPLSGALSGLPLIGLIGGYLPLVLFAVGMLGYVIAKGTMRRDGLKIDVLRAWREAGTDRRAAAKKGRFILCGQRFEPAQAGMYQVVHFDAPITRRDDGAADTNEALSAVMYGQTPRGLPTAAPAATEPMSRRARKAAPPRPVQFDSPDDDVWQDPPQPLSASRDVPAPLYDQGHRSANSSLGALDDLL